MSAPSLSNTSYVKNPPDPFPAFTIICRLEKNKNKNRRQLKNNDNNINNYKGVCNFDSLNYLFFHQTDKIFSKFVQINSYI